MFEGVKRAVLVSGAALVLLMMPSAASAETEWIKAMNVSPQIATDNHRYLSYQRRDALPVVLDTWTGKIRELEDAWTCHPRDIGGGKVLMICPHSPPNEKHSGFYARIGSVLGGKTWALPKSGKLEDAYEIGRFWVAVKVRMSSLRAPVPPPPRKRFGFLNLKTHKIARYASRRGHDYAFGGVNLDRRKLKPGKAARFTPDLNVPEDYAWKYPYLCRGEDVVVSDWRGELRLWWNRYDSVRLGNGGILFSTCQWYQTIRFSRSWATWSQGGSLHAYNFRNGKRFNLRAKRGSRIAPIGDGLVIARKLERFSRNYTTFRIRFVGLQLPD